VTAPATAPLTVDVWSDVVCPWCRIGRAELERALAAFPHSDDVEVTWHSYELDPHAPAITDEPLAVQLARKYGIEPEQAEGMFDDVRERARPLGLDLRFEIARPGNTFDAHRLLHLARARGCQDALKGRLFQAYFTEGAAIGDPEVLSRLAVEVGLDPDEVRDVLASDRYAQDVRADEEQAGAYGVRGVPFFVIDGRYGVAGAQSAEHLASVLDRAWSERVAEAD
jgi:predicted DsbA family dithiol-disulfide isomerase